MPRDGSHIYTLPFPDVTEGTTVESAVYNGFTNDVAQDLNAPRPISAGGTGADNAADAMSNLGGEGSKIEVTNYDSHNFTAGSFYSKASATAPPVAGHAFAGWCYPAVVAGVATTDLFIEVRDRDDLTQPGSLYARQRKAGVWSGWLKAAGVNANALPPDPATDNSLWWDPTQGKLFIRYNDGDTVQWVETTAVPDLGPDDFVSVDIDQVFTEAQKKTARSNIYAAPFDALAFNGMQVNGSMDVSQERGTVANAANGYPADNWFMYRDGTMAVAAAQGPTNDVPGISNIVYIAITTAQASLTASNQVMLFQNIEGYRVARLAWGTAKAQPLTIGFWTAHTRPGVYSVAIFNGGGGGDRGYATTYTQNVGAVFQYNVITIPGDTAGTWAKANTSGMQLKFCMAASAGATAPSANTWYAGNPSAALGQINGVAATSDIFRITGVVVLPGIEAPSAERSPLIMRPYDQELQTCKRYYQRLGKEFVGRCESASVVTVMHDLSPEMRATPTLAFIGSVTNHLVVPGVGFITITALNSQSNAADAVYATFGAGGSMAAGNMAVGWTNDWLSCDARL